MLEDVNARLAVSLVAYERRDLAQDAQMKGAREGAIDEMVCVVE
jgi:hypothetical protein